MTFLLLFCFGWYWPSTIRCSHPRKVLAVPHGQEIMSLLRTVESGLVETSQSDASHKWQTILNMWATHGWVAGNTSWSRSAICNEYTCSPLPRYLIPKNRITHIHTRRFVSVILYNFNRCVPVLPFALPRIEMIIIIIKVLTFCGPVLKLSMV